MGMVGFPVLGGLNEIRENFHTKSHSRENNFTRKVSYNLGHKVISVFLFPANLGAICLGSAAIAMSVSTLGALKVAIFAFSFGEIVPEFSIGVPWLAKCVWFSMRHVFWNLQECFEDINHVIEKLSLKGFIKGIFFQIGSFFEFLGNRLIEGFNRSAADERGVGFGGEVSCSLLSSLSDVAKESRIKLEKKERFFREIFIHSLYSVPNISLNTVALVISGVASIILCAAFLGKTSIYTFTGLKIFSYPTFAGRALSFVAATLENIVLDVSCNIADCFITMYKISEFVGITKIFRKIWEVLEYTPRAVIA